MSLGLATLHVRKSYGGNDVLKDCSFSFSENRIYVLTGANGCGKSTFLRICCLLEEPDSGEIRYFSQGGTIEKDLSLRRRISLVLPKVGIFNTTVFRNVSYVSPYVGSKVHVWEFSFNSLLYAIEFFQVF